MFSSGAAGTLNHWAVSSLVFLRKLLLKRSGLELLISHYISSFWAHEDSFLGKLKRDAIVEQVYRNLPWLCLGIEWRNDYLGVRTWRFHANNFLFTSKIKVSAPTLLEAVFLLTCIPRHNIKQLSQVPRRYTEIHKHSGHIVRMDSFINRAPYIILKHLHTAF